MNAFTHLGIAKILHRLIEKELSVRLDPIGFRYGNVKPDISPALIRIPHFKEDALDFVKLEIKKLLDYKLNRFPKGTRQFSERLGVITHYLSDFFCYVHSSHFTGGTLAHYVYEMNLSNFCKLNPSKMKNFKNIEPIKVYEDYTSICDNIDDLHNKYMHSKPSFELDITYTLSTCASICISIISACMAEELQIAA